MALPYRPFERRTLENLLATPGLPGGFAYDVFQQTQQGALDRLMQQRAMRQERQALNQQVLPQASEFAANIAGAGLPSSIIESAYSGYGPRVQGGLDSLIGSLYPGGADISPYAAPAETAQLTGEDLANIDADIQAAVAQGRGLQEVKAAILGRLQVLGVPETTVAQMDQYIEERWVAAGGQVGGGPADMGGGGSAIGAVGGGLVGAGLGALVGHPFIGAAVGSAAGSQFQPGGYLGGAVSSLLQQRPDLLRRLRG